VLYDTMNREDLNWRKFHEQVAQNLFMIFSLPIFPKQHLVKKLEGAQVAYPSIC